MELELYPDLRSYASHRVAMSRNHVLDVLIDFESDPEVIGGVLDIVIGTRGSVMNRWATATLLSPRGPRGDLLLLAFQTPELRVLEIDSAWPLVDGPSWEVAFPFTPRLVTLFCTFPV